MNGACSIAYDWQCHRNLKTDLHTRISTEWNILLYSSLLFHHFLFNSARSRLIVSPLYRYTHSSNEIRNHYAIYDIKMVKSSKGTACCTSSQTDQITKASRTHPFHYYYYYFNLVAVPDLLHSIEMCRSNTEILGRPFCSFRIEWKWWNCAKNCEHDESKMDCASNHAISLAIPAPFEYEYSHRAFSIGKREGFIYSFNAASLFH